MIRIYEVRGTASHRNICDAGLHASEVVLYQEAKGPKLCPSLEQSIAQILSHNSQILEDLECERYIYVNCMYQDAGSDDSEVLRLWS